MTVLSMRSPLARLSLRAIGDVAFAPYGTVVAMGRSTVAVNEGTALRHDVDAFPAHEARRGFRLVTSIYDAEARALPQAIGILERHPNSAQLIVPLGGAGHAVVVCLSGPDGRPDLATLAAFRCSPRQGIIHRRGSWHYPIAALGAPAQFLVQSWQDASDSDCEIVSIAAHDIVVDAAVKEVVDE